MTPSEPDEKKETPKRMSKRLVRLLRPQHPDANYLKKVFHYVRQSLELTGQRPPGRKLPELLTEAELRRLSEALLSVANPQHLVMIKTLLFTGVRNGELVRIEIRDVDLASSKLRVRQGKGGVDRDVPLPDGFRGELVGHLDAARKRGDRFLLESRLHRPFTTRRIRQILKQYATAAGIEKRLYPHLFRHQLLTYLTAQGVGDAQLQLVSGHRSRESLALYQTLSLADVQPNYQKAMTRFPIR